MSNCVVCGRPFKEWQRRHPVFDADSDRAGEAHPACAGIRETFRADNEYSVKLDQDSE